MRILVTGATGQLGRRIVNALLSRGIEADNIILGARDRDRALAEFPHMLVSTFDYAKPETLSSGLSGVSTLMFISSTGNGTRVRQHQAVIQAAATAGVSKLVYTSATRAATSSLALAPDHKATEEAIVQSGVPAVILRNNWYMENYAGSLREARASGLLFASVGAGRVAAATRADFAEAAAEVLIADGHLGCTYELSGDIAWDYKELAATMSRTLEREVRYVPLSTIEHARRLRAASVPDTAIAMITSLDASIAQGDLDISDSSLRSLLRRPTTTLGRALQQLAQVPSPPPSA